MKFTITGQLPGMNEIIAASKTHFGAYSSLKKKYSKDIMSCIFALKTIDYYAHQVDVLITWHCQNKRRDKDNITAGTKFILDALQTTGIIQNDNWKGIGKITHDIQLDRKNPRIEVELIPVEVTHEKQENKK